MTDKDILNLIEIESKNEKFIKTKENDMKLEMIYNKFINNHKEEKIIIPDIKENKIQEKKLEYNEKIEELKKEDLKESTILLENELIFYNNYLKKMEKEKELEKIYKKYLNKNDKID